MAGHSIWIHQPGVRQAAALILASGVLLAGACGGKTEAAEPAAARSGPTVRPLQTTGAESRTATPARTPTATATVSATSAPTRTATPPPAIAATATAIAAPSTATSTAAGTTSVPSAGGTGSGSGGAAATATAAPRSAAPADTPAGTVLVAGQPWNQGGVTLVLTAIALDSTDVDGIRVAFTLTNHAAGQTLFQAPATVISAVDDAGRSYSADAAEPQYSFPVEPGETVHIPRDVRGCCTSELPLLVDGDPRDATTLTISVNGLGPINGARWSVPIPK